MPKPWIQVTALPGSRESYRLVLPAGFMTVRVTGESAVCAAECHQYRAWRREMRYRAPEARYRVLRAALHAAAEAGDISPAALRSAETELCCAYAAVAYPVPEASKLAA